MSCIAWPRLSDAAANKVLARRIATWSWLALGSFLIVFGIVIAPLPGPFGLPVAVLGLMIVLRRSMWARRRFVRAQHAHPRILSPLRRLLRRRKKAQP